MIHDELLEKIEREQLTLASWQKRAGAHFIDDVLVSVLIIFILIDKIPANATTQEITLILNHFILYIIVLKVAYQLFFTWLYGATLGKIAMKIKIISLYDADKPVFAQALHRAVFRAIGEAVFYIGFLWAFQNPQRATWHDKIANTLVVNAL